VALADTAKLVVDLSLTGNFQSGISKAQRGLGGLNTALSNTESRAYKAGQQIGTGIKRSAFILTAAVGATIPLLISMAKEGQKAADVQLVFAKAIQNSGKITAANVTALKAQEEALLRLGGVDDELIKSEQTRLIQMGLTGDQVLKLTPLILDLSKATGLDLLTATKLAGKATQGNIGALSRYGVQIDKAKSKVDPFAATVDALNKKFGGTTQVLSGQLDTKLSVLREELANVREEAGIKLLPVFTRIVDIVGTRLVPAFSKLIDAILPDAIAGLNKFADFLDRGGGVKAIDGIVDTIKAVLPAIRSGAEITARVISTAVNLFKSLPPEIQSLAVAGFAVNKLTGGLVTNLAGGLISAVISQFKPLMNVTAGIVNVNGAVGGLPGGAPGGGGLGLVPALGLGALIVAAAVPIGKAFADALPAELKGPGGQGQSEAQQARARADAAQAALNTSLVRQLTADNRTPGSIFDRGGREKGFSELAGKFKDDLVTLKQLQTSLLDKLHDEFREAFKGLSGAKTADAIRKAIEAVNKSIFGKGIGGSGGAAATEKTLRGLLMKFPQLASTLVPEIRRVHAKVLGRQFEEGEFRKFDKIFKSNESTGQKIRDLQKIAKDVGAKDKKNGERLQQKIDALKHSQAIKQQQTTQAIKDKDLSVSVKVAAPSVTINSREVAGSNFTYSRYYKIS